MTIEDNRLAALKAQADSINLQVSALSKAIADLIGSPVAADPAPVPAPTPAPAIPTSASGMTATIGTVNGKTFTMPADNYVQKGLVTVTYPSGRDSHVVGVYTVDGTMYVTTNETGYDDVAKLTTMVGKQVKIYDRKDAQPSTSTPATSTPTAETPATTSPTTPAPAPAAAFTVAKLVDMGGEWVSGIYNGSLDKACILVENNAANLAAFVAGAMVTFVNGAQLLIQSVEVTTRYIKVWFDAKRLDLSLGGANTVSAPTPAAVPAPVYDTTPIVTAPGSKRGRLCLNLGCGAGGDTVIPGMQGRNRGYASEAEIVFAVNVLQCRHFRIGGLWETIIKPGGKSELYTGTVNGGPSAIDEVIRVLSSLNDKGCTAMPDLFHNYGGYSSTGTSADRIKVGEPGGPTIQRLALDHKAALLAIKAVPKAWAALTEYDTQNEWVGVKAANIKAFHQEFLNVCGPIMDGKIPVIEGDLWSSAVHWVDLNPGYADLTYPAGVSKVKCSGHLYLDQASSGFYNGDTVSADDAANGITTDNIFVKRLAAMEADVKAKGLTMNIGEHMVPGNLPKLIKGSENGIRHCIANGIDVHIYADSTWLDETHNILMPKNKPFLDMLMGIWAQEAA